MFNFEANSLFILPPLSIGALFYGYLNLLQATQKGKKSKELGFEVTPGDQTWVFFAITAVH